MSSLSLSICGFFTSTKICRSLVCTIIVEVRISSMELLFTHSNFIVYLNVHILNGWQAFSRSSNTIVLEVFNSQLILISRNDLTSNIYLNICYFHNIVTVHQTNTYNRSTSDSSRTFCFIYFRSQNAISQSDKISLVCNRITYLIILNYIEFKIQTKLLQISNVNLVTTQASKFMSFNTSIQIQRWIVNYNCIAN